MKTLERKYSKNERIVAKAKFSAWAYAGEVFIALVLAAAIALLWVYSEPVVNFFNSKTSSTIDVAAYQAILKWVMLGAAGLAIVLISAQAVALYGKEFIVTEDKIAMRNGVLNVKNIVIPLSEIRIVESEQNLFQRLVGTGNLLITSDAEKPYCIKGIKQADRLSRRIMRQVTYMRNNESKKFQLQLAGSVSTRRGASW